MSSIKFTSSHFINDSKIYSNENEGTNFINNFDPSCIDEKISSIMSKRFRGYYPVVIDIETAGFNEEYNPILQIGIVSLTYNSKGLIMPFKKALLNIHPFEDSILENSSLKFIDINPFDQNRKAINLIKAFKLISNFIRQLQKAHKCNRSIIVAHNVNFDFKFINRNMIRAKIKRNPFHPFVTFDTTSIAAIFFAETRLDKVIEQIKGKFDHSKAHNALYDAEQSAEIFINCVNKLHNNNLSPIINEDTSKLNGI